MLQILRHSLDAMDTIVEEALLRQNRIKNRAVRSSSDESVWPSTILNICPLFGISAPLVCLVSLPLLPEQHLLLLNVKHDGECHLNAVCLGGSCHGRWESRDWVLVTTLGFVRVVVLKSLLQTNRDRYCDSIG